MSKDVSQIKTAVSKVEAPTLDLEKNQEALKAVQQAVALYVWMVKEQMETVDFLIKALPYQNEIVTKLISATALNNEDISGVDYSIERSKILVVQYNKVLDEIMRDCLHHCEES
ncbi:MAG: hypothetical protein S4CHLAM6_05770 [Chlamydiae bacterium]|nr:hypothetical protein [Chlamydiota bacterium]